MVAVVYGGDHVFNALVSGEQHPNNSNYFRNQLESVSTALTDFGRSFYSNVHDLYDQFNGSEAMRLARDALRSVKGIFIENTIQYITDINSFQSAPTVMQRWIMANPVVREPYHQQKCCGYAGSYVDVSPGVIGEQHYDYRRVMTGVVQDTEDSWFVKFYPDEIHEGDRELHHDEKFTILDTWSIADMFMKKGEEDPTSPSGEFL